MSEERWFSAGLMVDAIKEALACSQGAAEAALIEACQSGRVRSREITLILDDNLQPTRYISPLSSSDWRRGIPSNCEVSEADLQYWFGPQPQAFSHTKGARYAADDDLVREACEGISGHRWPNAHQAALELADRAEGTSREAKIDRLGRKIREAFKSD